MTLYGYGPARAEVIWSGGPALRLSSLEGEATPQHEFISQQKNTVANININAYICWTNDIQQGMR